MRVAPHAHVSSREAARVSLVTFCTPVPARVGLRRGGAANRGASRMNFELQETTIHGHRVAYRLAGSGPPIVLIHGITASSVVVGARRTGAGAPPHRGGAGPARARAERQAARRLLDGRVRVGDPRSGAVARARPGNVVGHSLGGGVAMQFAYQFPERVERLALDLERGARAQRCSGLRARPRSPAQSSCSRCSPTARCWRGPCRRAGARARRRAAGQRRDRDGPRATPRSATRRAARRSSTRSARASTLAASGCRPSTASTWRPSCRS